MERILPLIEAYDVITIFRHVVPDGDAFGSQLGMAEIIRANYPNKKVYCLGVDPTGRMAKLFAPMDQVDDQVIASSLALVLDTANRPRIDDQRYSLATKLIKIDHHPDVDQFGDVQVVDTSSAACAQIIASWMVANGLKVSPLGARYLYTGIMTDTGRLSYGNLTPAIYRLVADLLEQGFDFRFVGLQLQSQAEAEARLKGYILSHFTLSSSKVASLIIPYKTLKKFGSDENAAGMVNTIGNVGDCEVWALICQGADGLFRAELRSKGVKVNAVAAQFGGGGHNNAAGARLASFTEAEMLIQSLKDAVEEAKLERLLATAREAAVTAGARVMEMYRADYGVETKDDDSPVTEADLAANQIIISTIKRDWPDHWILSEETHDVPERLNARELWIIDPIDGTKSYIDKTDDFAINIAYLRDNCLVVAVVAVPGKDEVYYAVKGRGAFRSSLFGDDQPRKLETRDDGGPLKVARSRHHQSEAEEEFYQRHSSRIGEVVEIGSAYKLCLVAAGEIDIVYKSGPGTKEWDVAAPDLVIKEAGGVFVDGLGDEFEYNRANVSNKRGYIALADRSLLELFKK